MRLPAEDLKTLTRDSCSGPTKGGRSGTHEDGGPALVLEKQMVKLTNRGVALGQRPDGLKIPQGG